MSKYTNTIESCNSKARVPSHHQFNPCSRYQEKVIIPHLTMFDIDRKPRQTPRTQCRQSIDSLNTLFHCPVCLGYLKKTFIVMECLHRFCGECIQKCLRLGKKECPSCRVHIPSRRSLRPDLNYDEIMKKMFGDVDALENREAKQIETWNKNNNMNNASVQKRKFEISRQAQLRKKIHGSKNRGNNSTLNGAEEKSDMSLGTVIRGGIINLEESKLVDFILRRHPQEKFVERLHRECIRTSEEITVGHLKKFLGMKLSYTPHYHFEILITLQGDKLVALDDDITLRDIRNDMFDRHNGPVLMLQYKRFVK
jgi:Uncharacterized conserved protein, contains RING Zn-finger